LRLAVFTNQFPSRVSTFFARDIAPLLRAGVAVEIFPFYPIDPDLWRYVPDILRETLSRSNIHHVSLAQVVRSVGSLRLGKLRRFLCDTAAVSLSAARFGVGPLARSAYVALKALAWAHQSRTRYDHILAYWGNYAGTSAYIFRRLTDQTIPFSIFLHAGIDLYENPVYLRQKLVDADKIITCSEFNQHFMQQHFPAIYQLISDRIYVHYHGVDLSEFRFESNGRPGHRILAIGGFYEYKGYDYLLRAAKELSIRGIKYEIDLVGDGKEADGLKALATKLQISDRVRFLGWLPPGEIPNVMRQATIFVHPSSRLADGVPNVIKESMAVGTPVVASSVAGIPELLGNGKYGILVPPKDVKALANAVETLLSNDELRLKYTYTARRRAEEKFDLWQNGQRLAETLYTTMRKK
jgi:glycosyltransferase involved in cell wall biosynthesis